MTAHTETLTQRQDLRSRNAMASEYREKISEERRKTNSRLFSLLSDYQRIEAVYSGCGDSGQFDAISAVIDGRSIPIEEVEPPEELAQLIRQTNAKCDALTAEYELEFELAFGTESRPYRLWFARGINLPDMIEEALLDLLNDGFPGWEINEGSDGTMTVHLGEGGNRLEWEHNEVIHDYNTHNIERIL